MWVSADGNFRGKCWGGRVTVYVTVGLICSLDSPSSSAIYKGQRSSEIEFQISISVWFSVCGYQLMEALEENGGVGE